MVGRRKKSNAEKRLQSSPCSDKKCSLSFFLKRGAAFGGALPLVLYMAWLCLLDNFCEG